MQTSQFSPPPYLYYPSHRLYYLHQHYQQQQHLLQGQEICLTPRLPPPVPPPSPRYRSPLNAMSAGHFRRCPLLGHSTGSTDRDSFDSDPGSTVKTGSTSTAMASTGGLSACRSTPSMRRRLVSLTRSSDSTDSSSGSSTGNNSSVGRDLLAAKANYRILVLGASRSGKTSVVRQFLYDSFADAYKPTMDDMYRGEFEIHHRIVGFDIQDVSGSYVYEFPGMRDVSLASADAFLLVFGLDDASSWEEVVRLRDMVQAAKDSTDVPIVVVGNKSDLPRDTDLPDEATLDATVVFDWENGYVECSAKDRLHINKIFKELLQQAKLRYDFTLAPMASSNGASTSATASAAIRLAHPLAAAVSHPRQVLMEEHLRRRQSLPAVPAGLLPANVGPAVKAHHTPVHHRNPLLGIMGKLHSSHKSVDHGQAILARANSVAVHHNNAAPDPVKINLKKSSVKRRSSLAALRRDSCKIS